MKNFKKRTPSFIETLRASLPKDFTLPIEISDFIKWLEAEKQVYQFKRTQQFFLPTIPVKSIDHLWSYFAFVIEPDLVRHWFGKDGLENAVVPLVKCGADGSHLAIWKNGKSNSYVFLGSEGEAFTITNDVKSFLIFITMGYDSVEGRFSLSSPPKEKCHPLWTKPSYVQNHIQKTYKVSYPVSAIELVEDIEEDPFIKFVELTCS